MITHTRSLFLRNDYIFVKIWYFGGHLQFYADVSKYSMLTESQKVISKIDGSGSQIQKKKKKKKTIVKQNKVDRAGCRTISLMSSAKYGICVRTLIKAVITQLEKGVLGSIVSKNCEKEKKIWNVG